MEKMWAGRTSGDVSEVADELNSSIRFDSRMYRQDILGSVSHAAMLSACGIITAEECKKITDGLLGILSDIDEKKLEIDMSAEDIHMFVEATLTKRIGEAGKKLHTARSRNDQVALDLRLYMRDAAAEIIKLTDELIRSVLIQAQRNETAIMPGYTHLQRAQPITFAHHLLAYAMMLIRDTGRVHDAVKRMNVSPLGSCALAGTTYPTDREMTAKALGFDSVCKNSIDGVSDRDYCVELLSAFALEMTHLSRFSEELVMWTSWEFGFVELDDSFTTGSSIMPQKKNSDMAELVRGKTGRVYGDLMAMLTVLKGLPLAYDKDMQEDKEAIFDATDTLEKCLAVFSPMIRTMKAKTENMYRAAQKGFINATDLADYLTKKGMAFRSAYKLVGSIVSDCVKSGKTFDELSMHEYKNYSALFEADVYESISLENCVARRTSEGGTGYDSVKKQIEFVSRYLNNSET